MTEVGYTKLILQWMQHSIIEFVAGQHRTLVGSGPVIVEDARQQLWCVVLLIKDGLPAACPSYGIVAAFALSDLSGASTARLEVGPSLTKRARFFQIGEFRVG